MKKTVKEFFAASNSYYGFISYFDKVFSPRDFDKIFILKGGPGTGKSTFMKETANLFEASDLICQKILCSSDPESLDGLIIENAGKKIAILDGTAPHATDPKMPGAIEKIINLGDCWNEKLLSANKEKIVRLTELKQTHYKNAYNYLSIAGLCVRYVDETIKASISADIGEIIDDIFLNTEKEDGKTQIMLTSSFGKRGFYETRGLGSFAEREINIVGIYGTEYYFMEKIRSEGKRRSLNCIMSPSPLDTQKTDALYFFSNNTAITVGNKNYSRNAKTIDTSKYIDVKKLDNNRNLLETLYKEREAMLWCATDEFKKAADTHMETEKIYTAAMNFKKNKKLLTRVCEEISKILLPQDENNTNSKKEP